MHRGYVKLWRKSLDSPVWRNVNLWRLWTWCLIKASHKEFNEMVGYQAITLMPGQFIFGRLQASKETGLSQRSVRTCLQTLKTTSNLTIKSTSKYSIVSIINWELYQVNECSSDHQIDHQKANKRPASDQQATTNKNDKNNKKPLKDLKESAIAATAIPSKEQIESAAIPKIETDIIKLCDRLYDEKLFVKSHAFANLMLKQKKNPRAVLHTLTRLYTKAQIKGFENNEKAPWSYGMQIVKVENGNFNERDYTKDTGHNSI